MADLAGKVLLVTGGGSGIGRTICELAAVEGARIAVADYDLTGAEETAHGLDHANAYKVDVSDAAAMEELCARIVRDFGKLDTAVNNAGVSGELTLMADMSLANWQRVIDVDLTGVFYSLRAEIPAMLANGGGSIVNISSMAGLHGEPRLGAYCAAKHGVIGLTKVAALEYALQGIRCNAVCPSFVKTPMVIKDTPEEHWDILNALHPIGRTLTVEEVAYAAIHLLSDKSSGTTGSHILVDGGAAAR